ncbi:MAG: ABC transporter substrate-binding protein [Spirochaetaceae bacterium]|nr:ABC transporter substrate-binding protein [Spirochaetaceae bacterium]
MNLPGIARPFVVVLVFALTATGVWASGESDQPAAAAEREMVLDPRTGEMVEAPRYGGTLTYATVMPETGAADEALNGRSGLLLVQGVLEKPSIANWALPADEWGRSMVSSDTPLWSLTGSLAESWETPDDTTIVLNIRQGVHWHDKPPMNGRELTADDIAYNYHRYLGLGSGFTEVAPGAGPLGAVGVESVTATDQWTVVIELERPNPVALFTLLQWYTFDIHPPEVIEEHGNINDWRNLVGTGPFMLTDYVEGSSVTWLKNPNYWGFDEKYPDNRLPYIDELVALIMREEATRTAALRSGKLDYRGYAGEAQLRTIDLAESLAKSNPEITQWPYYVRSEFAFGFNTSNPPFDDIRVRKALQMALDMETINETYLGGRGDITPHGKVGTAQTGLFVPFEEWPDEVKKGHRYDPEGAEKLLDEAGYPRGADGTRFKTSVILHANAVLSYYELAAAYWSELGIDLEIQVLSTGAEFGAVLREGTFEALLGSISGANYFNEHHATNWHSSSSGNAAVVSDPHMDAMIDALKASTSLDEYHGWFREIDMYAVEQHWNIWGPVSPMYHVSQPWLKGYNGEATMGNWQMSDLYARVWIDQELRAELVN